MEIRPDDVLLMTKPTKNFLCPLSANVYNIEFLSFAIRDYESKKTIFRIGKDSPPKLDVDRTGTTELHEGALRTIRYEFSEDVLRLPLISTELVFSVGNEEVRDFRMIERHYFKNKLVKSFDFKFGFCIPNSTNTWQAVYDVPPLDEDLINEMIAHPLETVSDSFYFVEDRLVMHNKAVYRYIEEDVAQAKKSYDDRYLQEEIREAKERGWKERDSFDEADGKSIDDDDSSTDDHEKGDEGRRSRKVSGWKRSFHSEEDKMWSKEDDYF